MNKFVIIIFLFVQCQAAASEKFALSFKPFDRITYYSYRDYKTPSFPDKNKSTGSVKVAKMLTYDKFNSNFGIELSDVVRDPAGPSSPKYETYEPWYTHSSYGIMKYWDFDLRREGFPGYDIAMVYESTILFPFFNKRRTFKVGEEMLMTIKMPFIFGIKDQSVLYYPKNKSTKDNFYAAPAQLTQKIAAVETLLGYRCARIEYGIDGKFTDKDDVEYILAIKGTVYFAIDEGFVVSDISKGFQDRMYRDGTKKRYHHWKKLRVLGYEPYQGEENE